MRRNGKIGQVAICWHLNCGSIQDRLTFENSFLGKLLVVFAKIDVRGENELFVHKEKDFR
jgi:hypothetical protein